MSSYRSQAVASTVLGTPLTFALCGLYAQFGPGDPATNVMAAVFLLIPVWTAIVIWGLKREDPRAAWLGLGGALALTAIVVLVARYVLKG